MIFIVITLVILFVLESLATSMQNKKIANIEKEIKEIKEKGENNFEADS